MIIDNVEIANFGFLKDVKLNFDSENINIIEGVNGSGKTTLLAILYSMFQDEEKIEYIGEGEMAHVLLNVREGSESFRLEKYYKNGTSEFVVPSLGDMKRLTSLNYHNVYLYSGEFLNYDYQFSDIMIKNAVDLLNKCGFSDRRIVNDNFHIIENYRYISGGQQAVIRILNMLSYIPQDSVLLLDAPFAMLDTGTIALLLMVMRQLQIQIILTANMHDAERLKGNKIYLQREDGDRYHGYPTFQYKEIFCRDMRTLIYNQKREDEQRVENKIVKYILGKEVGEAEGRNIEYKEIKGNHPCNSIVDVAEIYINAFLNSRVTGIGVIKWGISDDGIVKGVKLSKKDRDEIDRKISERIGQMKPYVSADIVQIQYENILDGNEIAKDLFIVEVIIRQWTSDILFSTSKGDVYIKTEGGKKKLDVYDIQNELKGRLRNSRPIE
ncbi:MAG: putative DNA binding domain-containing protein [Coprococcus sp.]|nr:putative DNA binding domain-containing protein [Coprococcus sp.]